MGGLEGEVGGNDQFLSIIGILMTFFLVKKVKIDIPFFDDKIKMKSL